MTINKQIPNKQHIYPSTNGSKKKTILLFHGWGSSVTNYAAFAEFLATLGFEVIVPELIFHDSRSRLANHFEEKIAQEYFWKTVFESIDEGKSLIEHSRIQAKDCLVLGISMGGFIANGLYANDPDFAGLININGSGSFLLSEELFRTKDNRPALSREERIRFNFYDPIGKQGGVSPVLLMHGELDAIVSIKGQEDYAHYLSEKCKAANLSFHKYKNINHTISEEMRADLEQWLKANFE